MSEDNEVAQILEAQEEAKQVARNHIACFEPFKVLPDGIAQRMLSDFRKLLDGKRVSRDEAMDMLDVDLAYCANQLLGLTAAMNYLTSAQRAVLFHVAMMIGVEALKNMKPLWRALQGKNFEAASDILMMSNWPLVVGDKPEEQRRVLDLARMMRAGLYTTEWASELH